MKAKLIFFISFMVILSSAMDVSARNQDITDQDSINKIIIQVTESSMHHLLDSIPDQLLRNYGINNRNELANATIGKPVGVYNIVNEQLVFTSTWRVPLVIQSEYRALFTVVRDDTGNYKVVDFGATGLAQEIFNQSLSYNIKGLLRVYELRKDFFICDDNKGEYEFQPVPIIEGKKYQLKDVLNFIRNQQ